jgi:putative oxidoreductase
MSNSVLILLARVLLSVIFILAGLQKFGAIDGTAGYIASVGLPASTLLAWAAAVFEVAAGVAILVGFQTKLTSLALAAFCLFTGFVFHYSAAAGDASGMQMIMFLKNLAITGGLLVLAAQGAGALSVDGKRGTLQPA